MALNRHLQRSFTLSARLSRPRRLPRPFPHYSKRFNSPNSPGQVNTDPLDQDAGDDDKGKGKGQSDDPTWKSTAFKIMETAATTFTSIAILGYVLLSP
jgi:hypothetical protein